LPIAAGLNNKYKITTDQNDLWRSIPGIMHQFTDWHTSGTPKTKIKEKSISKDALNLLNLKWC
jgi:hypothetical protein